MSISHLRRLPVGVAQQAHLLRLMLPEGHQILAELRREGPRVGDEAPGQDDVADHELQVLTQHLAGGLGELELAFYTTCDMRYIYIYAQYTL